MPIIFPLTHENVAKHNEEYVLAKLSYLNSCLAYQASAGLDSLTTISSNYITTGERKEITPKLLMKIEELDLYISDLDKRIKVLEGK